MPGRRSMRYHQRRLSDDEFETPAFQVAAERNDPPRAASDESDDDLQSESGLGESPEEDFIEEAGESSDDAGKEDDPGTGSDSDSAPEEVSFAKSREAEAKRQQLITGEIRKGKSEERERRRKRDELFKLQRKEKLAALNKRKLPEELLEELSHQSEKKLKTDESNQNEKDDKEVAGSRDVKEDLSSDSDEEEEKEEEDGGEASAEFLPLTDTQQGRVQVVSLQGSEGHGGVVAPSVADFKQAMLYGHRHKRVTSEQARNIKAKRQARR